MIKDIKAYQGYMSLPMKKFRWLTSFGLEPYRNKNEPLVVFGCYKPIDHQVILNHRGSVIVIWMGTDVHKVRQVLAKMQKKNIIHITWLARIKRYLTDNRGLECHLVKLPVKEYPKPKPIILGKKVYAYLSKGKPEYHGSEIVNKLNLNGYPLLVGDNTIGLNKWYNEGQADIFYSQAFIGLALSKFVGGAMTIQEMAVRGIKVVTNVLSLPNCIPWKTLEDVEQAIWDESKRIGTVNTEMVEDVYKTMVDIKECFNLNKLLV